MHFQPGPLARRVEDLECAMRIFAASNASLTDEQVAPLPWRESSEIDVSRLRIGVFSDDGYARPHPSICRAVEQAAAALRQRGADVEAFKPPDVARGMMLYFGLIGADGSAALKRLSEGSVLDHRVASLLRLGGTSRWYRPFIAGGLRSRGMHQLAEIVAAAGPRSASSYWQLTDQARSYAREFMEQLDKQRFDAIICPPHAMPAFRHGQGKANSMMAASYAFIMNLLGIPCGVVPAGCIPNEEANDDEVGMPVGVQVAARHWREDVVLAVMQTLEESFGTFRSFSPLFK
jgi:fatty acid amide hydrolase